MTTEEVAAGDGTEERRTVLVGVQLDGNGRELLDWALARVAQQGDRVLAVHICRTCGFSPLSLIRALDEYLEEYEGLCNLKQVALVGRVSRGNSIRRTLVKEAKLCSAAAVLVGVNRGSPFGGTISVARYCAKKLPPTTSLLAVHNGKVILEREASMPPAEGGPKITLASMVHPSFRMDSQAAAPPPDAEPYSEAESSRTSDAESLRQDLRRREADEADAPSPSYSKAPEAEPVSGNLLVRKQPETTPGWPLLRRTVLASPGPPRETDAARKMSVVQWVMNLPNRTLTPEVTPDGTPSPSARGSPSSPASLREELEGVLEKNNSSCRWFSHVELQNYTDQFSSENLIGKGGSSRVYRGCLRDGQRVAVKIAKLNAEASRDFLSEIDIITSLHHKNVVSLVGINVEDNDLVSVYRFFSRGSLEENLHGRRAKPPLPWDSRFKIALGVAEALNYLHLHSSCPRPIIHRDVKSSNILLSDDFDPQLSDFGLALWAPNSSYTTHSDVVGTFGYLAPEYFMYGKVSHKIDVYSFGVVLLELVAGRKPISNDLSRGKGSLVMWATQVLEQGEVTNLLDPNLDANYDKEQVQRVVFAASLCLRRSARLRPPMSEILRLLKGEEDMAAWMSSHVGKGIPENSVDQDEEVYPPSSVASHLGLALLDVDDAASVSSAEQSYQGSLEDYLKGRWSRSSSFD